jgi:Putative metal-binding motif
VIGLAVTLLLTAPPCTALGKPIADHACLHALHGPFAEGPSVDQVHTYFRVALPAGAAQTEVTYRPARSGDWALFRNPDVPVSVVDPAGQALPARLELAVAACPELPRASVFPLDAGVSYRVVLGPSSTREVGLVFEKLSDFVNFYYADQDRDGHGDPAGEIETACTPPDHHVDNDGDCDDRTAAVHPGAAEACNGRDDDCDGRPDEDCPGTPDAGPAAGRGPGGDSPSSCQIAQGNASALWGLGAIGLVGFARRLLARRTRRTRP